MADIDIKISARDVERIVSGLAPTTLNVWISRGLISGVSGLAQGRRRFFDIGTVTYIAVLASLVRLGYESTFAAFAAESARKYGFDKPGLTLIIGQPVIWPSDPAGPSSLTTKPDISVCSGGGDVAVYLTAFDSEEGGRPEAYVVCEVWRIVERVKKFIANLAAEKRS